MKNILKGTIIFAICLTLAACGTGSPQDITVQSITEPMTTVQTVGNVPEVTAVAESTIGTVRVPGTEDWEEPVETEPDDPNAGLETEAYTGVTLPDFMDDDIPSSVIVDLFYKELPEYSWTDYEAGESTYAECNECYKKLLVEKLHNGRDEFFEFFGGAYFSDDRLFLRITDVGKKDEIFSDFFDDLESVDVVSCKYSYSDLLDVWETVRQNEHVKGHIMDTEKNHVWVSGTFTDEDKENILADLEAAGFDSDAVELAFEEDCPVMNPC